MQGMELSLLSKMASSQRPQPPLRIRRAQVPTPPKYPDTKLEM
jgi:hypothetical protein